MKYRDMPQSDLLKVIPNNCPLHCYGDIDLCEKQRICDCRKRPSDAYDDDKKNEEEETE